MKIEALPDDLLDELDRDAAYNFSDGPLRHSDVERRCASRGCTSPTHFKLDGIPYCMMHCLREMNVKLAK
jgi:hypothetical protein